MMLTKSRIYVLFTALTSLILLNSSPAHKVHLDEVSQLITANQINQKNEEVIGENAKKISEHIDTILLDCLNNNFSDEKINEAFQSGPMRIESKDIIYSYINKDNVVAIYNIPIGNGGSLRKITMRIFHREPSKSWYLNASSNCSDFLENIDPSPLPIDSTPVSIRPNPIPPISLDSIPVRSIFKLPSTKKWKARCITIGHKPYFSSAILWLFDGKELQIGWGKVIPDYFASAEVDGSELRINYPKDTKIPGIGTYSRKSAFIEIYKIEENTLKVKRVNP